MGLFRLFGNKNEYINQIEREVLNTVRAFESKKRKEKIDYDLLIIKLGSIKDNVEYQLEVCEDRSISNLKQFEKARNEIEDLISKYKKESFDKAMKKSDEIIDRALKLLK